MLNDNEQGGSDAASSFSSTKSASSKYAPPWARDGATDAVDAAAAATGKSRGALPPAPLLKYPEARVRRRGPAAFEGDIALRELRARASLDPVGVPEPPVVGSRSTSFSLLGRLSGAAGLAALAALFMFGAPGSQRGGANAVDEGAPSICRACSARMSCATH